MIELSFECILMIIATVEFVAIVHLLGKSDNLQFDKKLLEDKNELHKKRQELQRFEEYLADKYSLEEKIKKDGKILRTPYGLATIDDKGFYVLPNGEKLYEVIVNDLTGENE